MAKDATNYGLLFLWDVFSLQPGCDALRGCHVLPPPSEQAPIPTSREKAMAVWATHLRCNLKYCMFWFVDIVKYYWILFNSPRDFGPFPPPPFYQHFSTFVETPEAKFFKPHMVDLWVWKKKFYTHFGDLGSWSLSYRSGTQFTLSPW